jgi:hypothetical protein
MRMRRITVAFVLAATSWLAGCDSGPSTPVSPSAYLTGVASTTPVPSGFWQLTTTLTSVAGPRICFDGRSALGRVTDAVLDVRRDGEAITLVYDLRNYPTDHLELVGTVTGDRFEATTTWPGYQPCGGARVDYEFESYVTGRISDDGSAIVASERWTYRLGADLEVVLWFSWEAQRR